jgi:hypothetical protein
MALSIGAMLLGIAVLFFSITRLLALLRDSEVARLPAVAEQEVRFAQAGTFVLNAEQPRLGAALSRAQFSLRDAAGREVPSSAILFRTHRSGFATTSIALREFTIERAGAYRLSITGIDATADASRSAVVFTTPYAAAMVALILAIIFGAACTIGGLVFGSLRYAGKI